MFFVFLPNPTPTFLNNASQTNIYLIFPLSFLLYPSNFNCLFCLLNHFRELFFCFKSAVFLPVKSLSLNLFYSDLNGFVGCLILNSKLLTLKPVWFLGENSHFRFLLIKGLYKKWLKPGTPWPWLVFCEEHVKEHTFIELPMLQKKTMRVRKSIQPICSKCNK